jgi:hypothetical protein
MGHRWGGGRLRQVSMTIATLLASTLRAFG